MTLTDCPDESMPALTAMEVCQVLRDAIFGRRAMVRLCARTWGELYTGMLMVDIEALLYAFNTPNKPFRHILPKDTTQVITHY
ncbi:DUF7693 family protein [Pseudomonas yamanorum]